MTDYEMVGWHYWLDGHEFEQGLAIGDGQGGLASCSPWGHKELDMTEWLNWLTEAMYQLKLVLINLSYEFHFPCSLLRNCLNSNTKGNEREGKFYTIKLLEKEVTNGVKQEQKSRKTCWKQIAEWQK